MQNTTEITETGCYLDNHRGHYIARDVVWLAEELGFILGPLEKWFLDCYEDHNGDEDYPAEIVNELCDDAIAWLNVGENSGLDRPIKGQNSPPKIPDGTAWEFNDGDFGLYTIEDDE